MSRPQPRGTRLSLCACLAPVTSKSLSLSGGVWKLKRDVSTKNNRGDRKNGAHKNLLGI